MRAILTSCILAGALFSCSNKVLDQTYSVDTRVEIAQQIGETVAALDEIGGSATGDYAHLSEVNYERAFARLAPGETALTASPLRIFLPYSWAGSCSDVAFGSCSAAFQKVRNISGCSTLASGGTLSGSIKLTFSGTGQATCTMPAVTDGVIRTANLGVSGLRGAVFGIQNISDSGQSTSRTGAVEFTFNDSGTSRKFTDPYSNKLLDLTAETPTPLTVSGTTRATRTITAGVIRVKDNLQSVTCDFTPTSVAWSTGCNCPTAGNFSAVCSDTTAMNLAFGATCGRATLTVGTTATDIYLDRCE